MAEKNGKKTKTRGQSIFAALYSFILFGSIFISAYNAGRYATMLKKSGQVQGWLFIMTDLFIVLFLLGLFLILFLQIMIHESGHLIFGLLTGYEFSSFRIGSLMWIKENGRIKLRKISIAGTGGQCLMVPPNMTDGKIPFVLYNLGGSLMNIISGIIFFALYMISRNILYLPVFMLTAGIIGIAFGLLNGIPMHLGTIDNDGYNTISISKSNEALRAFWLQLKVNGQIAQGIRLKDMPEEWFEVPDDEKMKNSIIAVTGVLAANRLMDLQRFEEAEQLTDKLIGMDSAIVDLHRRLLINDLIYCRLIKGYNEGQISGLLDKQQKKFMMSMKNFPSVIRTEYAIALLEQKDPQKAQSIREKFDKNARSYPYPCEVDSERELIDIAVKAASSQ